MIDAERVLKDLATIDHNLRVAVLGCYPGAKGSHEQFVAALLTRNRAITCN